MTGRTWTRGDRTRPRREIPQSLRHALIRACDVEDSTEERRQLLLAVEATSNILYAGVCAGWSATDLGRAIGMDRSTVGQRVRVARARHEGRQPVGLDIEGRPRPPHPLNVLRQPVEDREWFTSAEARAHTGASVSTLQSWLRNGLLPNSYMATRHRRLFLRADLDRVMHAPRYNRNGAHHQAIRDAIAESGI